MSSSYYASVTVLDSTNSGALGAQAIVMRGEFTLLANNGITLTEYQIDQNLPKVTITAIGGAVSEGELVKFMLKANGLLTDEVQVNVALTQIGDFINGNTVISKTLLEQGWSILEVETIDDQYIENDGQVTASILSGRGYLATSPVSATVVVFDNDRHNDEIRAEIANIIEEMQPIILNEIFSDTNIAIDTRMSQAFNESADSRLILGGNEKLSDVLKFSGKLANQGAIPLTSVIKDSSFLIELFPETNGYNSFSIWGVGDHGEFRANSTENSFRWNGNMTEGFIGIDKRIGKNVLFGIATSITGSEFDFISDRNSTVSEGDYSFQNTGIHPYFGWISNGGTTEVQTKLGYGIGNVTIDSRKHGTETAGTAFMSAAINGSRILFDMEGKLQKTQRKIRVKSESWVVRQDVLENSGLIDNMQLHDYRFFVAAEGTQRSRLVGDAVVNLTSSIGVGWNGKKHDRVPDLEIDGDVNYQSPFGFELSGKGRGKVTDHRSGIKWGVNGLFKYDHESDKLGAIYNVSPSWGVYQSNDDNGIQGLHIGNTSNEHTNPDFKLDATIGYGFWESEKEWLLTPQTGMSFSNSTQKYTLGSSLALDQVMDIKLEWASKLLDADSEQKVEISGSLNW